MDNWISLLNISRHHDHAVLLVSNEYDDPYGRYQCMFGGGIDQQFDTPKELQRHSGLAFGHIGYHFKNQLYRKLYPENETRAHQWSEFFFFKPKAYYLESREGKVDSNFELQLREDFPRKRKFCDVNWEGTETEQSYLLKIEEIKECIRNGVFYEMNFCQGFQSHQNLDPYELFYHLNTLSPSPFACFYKMGEQFLIGASPERFLQKTGNQLISQPIKGTARRSGKKDEEERLLLSVSEKDRAENIMIVDLVRNDLSKVSKVGSVQVEELCGIYTYPTVHQMISTIKSELETGKDFGDILEALFPMGSMTGAPKIEVMKHIDRLENFRRELYSGAIGYWNAGDFDLNVVIRSIEYHQKHLQYFVGGAITFDSVGAEEWKECQTKASGLRRLFED